MTDPNHRFVAKLFASNGQSIDAECLVWLPEKRTGRPTIQIASNSQGLYEIYCHQPWTIVGTERGFNGRIDNCMMANNVWIHSLIGKWSGSSREIRGTCSCLGFERFSIVRKVSRQPVSARTTDIGFHISENILLEPIIQRTFSLRGGCRTRRIASTSIRVPNMCRFVFDRQFAPIRDGCIEDQRIVSWLTVAPKPVHANPRRRGINRSYLPCVEDLLLLSSLAAKERTFCCGWTLIADMSITETYLDPPQREGTDRSQQRDQCLIAPTEFEEFLRTSLKTLKRLDQAEIKLVKSALYSLTPWRPQTLEIRYMNLFASLEAIVLLHRRRNDQELTFGNKSTWTMLEKALRRTIDSLDTRGDERFKPALIKQMLPMLKRIPLQSAFDDFCAATDTDLSDLWPVFDSAKGLASLSELRNRLVHGDGFSDHQIQALGTAETHLEKVVERMVLSVLRFPIDRSSASEAKLRQRGWVSYALVDQSQRELHHRPE